MNKSGAWVVLWLYNCIAYTICVEILLCLASSAIYSIKLVAYTNSVENYFT